MRLHRRSVAISAASLGAGRGGDYPARSKRHLLPRRSRGPGTRQQRGQQLLADPLLIVEILSPGTGFDDRHTKVPDYRRIPSVEEILLIDSENRFARFSEGDEDRWITELVQGRAETLSVASIGLTVAMAELYDGIDIPDAQRSFG